MGKSIVLSTIRCWWRAIVHNARTQQEIEEEHRFLVDAYTQDLMGGSATPEEAARRARLELGRPDRQRERYREAIGLRLFDEMGADLRYGLRSLMKNPAFSWVAILSLALGIGATTAMFSLIYAVLLHPFAYSGADRIMNPVLIDEQHPQDLRWFALWKTQFDAFGQARPIESLLGFANARMEMMDNGLAEDALATYLTENAGSFFGVHALLGRMLQPADARGGGQPVAVLNYRFWQRHFLGDPAVIGRTLQLDHQDYTIVGVMPRSFAFNDTTGVADLYLPRSLLKVPSHVAVQPPYIPWIKLKKGVDVAAADAELSAMVHQFAKENPDHFPKQFHLRLQPIILPYRRDTGRPLLLLFAGVLLLLAIGCTNCSILLLARSEARQHELAVRSAIGASRWRIVRQLLVEALLLSLTGAAIGVAASYWLAKLPLKLSPGSFPPEAIIRINLPILGFCFSLALVCGILFGLAPALRLSRPDVAQMMQMNLRRTGGLGKSRRLNGLIAGQMTLTLLLLATAGMATNAFLQLAKAPLGYNPNHVMQAGIVMHWKDPNYWSRFQARDRRAAFIEQMREQIAAIPGVLSAAVGVDATPPFAGADQVFAIQGNGEDKQQANVSQVGQDYFATLEIPLLRGRMWDAAENRRGDFVAVVNERFARRYWPHGDAIGKQIRIPMKETGPLDAASAHSSEWRQIVGIVGDVRNEGMDGPMAPAIYVPYTAMMPPYTQFLIRTKGEPLSLLNAVRAAIQTVSADQQVTDGSFDLTEAIERDAHWSRQRLFTVLFGFFSAMALTLAVVGLASVVWYSVTQRTAEFGIRMALGASRGQILWAAARIAVLSTAVGIAAGLLVDIVMERFVVRWMGIGHTVSGNLAAATLLLVLCATAACLLSAKRAGSIHPADALRYE